MTMDPMLARHFGNDPTATAESAEKLAAAEEFAKIAEANGIDLSQLNDAQIEFLWNKVAAEGGSDEESEDDKKKKALEAAKAEHAEKQAEQAEQADANTAVYFGKTAAHAYVAELRGIAESGGLDFFAEKIAGKLDKAKEVAKNVTGIANFENAHRIRQGVASGKALTSGKAPSAAKEIAKGVAKATAVGGAAGAAGYGASKALKKEGSFDLAAAQHAFEMIQETGAFDEPTLKEAAARLDAALTLGLQESEKVASLQTFEDALHVRALEFAEAIGVAVDWQG